MFERLRAADVLGKGGPVHLETTLVITAVARKFVPARDDSRSSTIGAAPAAEREKVAFARLIEHVEYLATLPIDPSASPASRRA